MHIAIKQKNCGYGDFGNLSATYGIARREFPPNVISYLQATIPLEKSVVDLGCGTGISTRQIADRCATVIGVDRDKKMISAAETIPHHNITYICAKSEDLPFANGIFDAATAFSSFHWFANEKALNEIQRVLKSSGVFFVVNKNDTGEFKKNYRAIIKKFARTDDLPDIKKNYKPAELLRDYFTDITERVFQAKETFSVPQALTYFQSVSLWNLVPKEKQPEARKALEKHCKSFVTPEGFIEREISIITILGRKPAI
ncbi:MAG: hypothetical protein A3H01_00590 [Candidatus Wildermuthbacteria bacterium RIFCSPLOWO2_12_FULL_40_9]|uniref:Methyltransferase type 11 domain-containing protein n=1 Tax=Candidatus Wildermuthbacteria bacterium RIFCSPLOWO2_12_FULL_40_9 TaxID=1802467 RepID=A0A1G2RY83_9BACT|nr:MAG: hypothetical protein A3H01_00590 [Candidatus Wildermuthbacteria bacterium RIFCSPLOWO2_12_FULL_40_9]